MHTRTFVVCLLCVCVCVCVLGRLGTPLSPAKMAKPVEVPSVGGGEEGGWKLVWTKESCIKWGCTLVPGGGYDELSMPSGDACLCQFTLTSC